MNIYKTTGELLWFSDQTTTMRVALRRAIAAETDLRGANLRGADLTGADLTGSDLRDTRR